MKERNRYFRAKRGFWPKFPQFVFFGEFIFVSKVGFAAKTVFGMRLFLNLIF
jgi:hypothetical protein